MNIWLILFLISLFIAFLENIYIAIKIKVISMKKFYIIGITMFSLYAISAMFLGMNLVETNPLTSKKYDIGLILVESFVNSVLFGLIVLGVSTGYQKINNIKTERVKDLIEPKKSKSFIPKYFEALYYSILINWERLKKTMIRNPIKVIVFILLLLQYKYILSFFDQMILLLRNKNSFFYDNTGNFEWLAVTAIIAIVTLFVNSIYSAKRVKADLVSKSRIQWIQSVRQLLSEYLTKTRYITFLCIRISEEMQREARLTEHVKLEDSEVEKLKKTTNENILEMFQIKNMLLLNFSNNRGNSEILNIIIKVADNIDQYFKEINDKNFNITTSYEDIDNLTELGRDYFKEEWEVAKRGN